tara:strand:+ start:281 stop:1012 length:732 start_codon:yes stop_codon:yes gene_type:complete
LENYNKNHEKEAVAFYRSDKIAVLSTISKKYEGYPFGSFVTYVSGWDRTTFLYLSDLADHTKNLKKDHKSCITIFKKNESGDVQNSARLTLIGDLKKVPDKIYESCKDRFHNFFPESKVYEQMHDFNFYQISVTQARWIGGFGKISWLDPKNWMNVGIDWINSEKAMIDHMNNDHLNTIKSALSAVHGVKDPEARMIGLSIDGYYILSKGKFYFIKFDVPVFTSKGYRNVLIELSKKYRSYEF